jgi:hypothetical protein
MAVISDEFEYLLQKSFNYFSAQVNIIKIYLGILIRQENRLLNRFINLIILVKENAAYLVSAAGISSTLGTQKVHHCSTIEIKVKFNRDKIHKGHFDENL